MTNFLLWPFLSISRLVIFEAEGHIIESQQEKLPEILFLSKCALVCLLVAKLKGRPSALLLTKAWLKLFVI